MTTPTDNHRLSAEPRLELVGGEWKKWSDEHYSRDLGLFELEVYTVTDESDEWSWTVMASLEPVIEGTAPTREEAIAAAEAALLEEISRFVRVRQ